MNAPSIDQWLGEIERPVGRESRRVVEAVRGYLGEVRVSLEELHRQQKSGQVVNEAHSDLTDRMVRRLFALAEESILVEGGELEMGRREWSRWAAMRAARCRSTRTSTCSCCIAIELTPYVAQISRATALLDVGRRDHGGLRDANDRGDGRRSGARTRRSGLAVLMARFLCGDGEFFHQSSPTRSVRSCCPMSPPFVAERREGMRARHERYGESLFLLQPNLKEGAGCAARLSRRLLGRARRCSPPVRDLDDWLHHGLLTELEIAELRGALDFLWRARNELHLISEVVATTR